MPTFDDLGRVVSKYLGETEKNLRRLFDVVRRDGAPLLLDEGDALFANRSGVADAHDRYGNTEGAPFSRGCALGIFDARFWPPFRVDATKWRPKPGSKAADEAG